MVNANATVFLENVTMTLTAQTGKSPIAVKSGVTANIELVGTSTLRAGNASGVTGGGAGIAVPAGATLNVTGSGLLNAYGGDAGDGGDGEDAPGAWDTYGGGGGGGGYPAAGIGGGGASGGRGTGGRDNATHGLVAMGAGGAGAGAGIGGIGADGLPADAGYNSANGNSGGAAGAITVNARVNAFGGGGGSGGTAGIGCGTAGNAAGGGGGGFSGGAGTTSSIRLDAATNGAGGKSAWGTSYHLTGCLGGGGGYFSAGGDGSISYNPGYIGGSVGGGGAAVNMGICGDGGAGGAGGTITIVDSSKVVARNGSKITTSTSQSQGYLPANATTIKAQSNQGYGAGAGYTENNGTVVMMGAPGVPTSVTAALVGTYGENVQLKWKAPTNTGGDGVALTGYTIISPEFGVNLDLSMSQVTTGSDGFISYVVTGLISNKAGTFTVAAKNAKGAGSPATALPSPIVTKGVPLAPQDVEARNEGLPNDTAEVLWNAPDTSYNNNPITGYVITLEPIGKANSATEEKFDVTEDKGLDESVGPISITVNASSLETENGKYKITLNGLWYGTVYNATVAAINGMGSGATQSEQALVETPSVASAPSVEVTRVNEESTKLNVSWQKPD
ncbi:MAG: fibronectin type III domain-containing protein, partial [Oscillospiraceae bacterium]|nr:fibronectin type III domain-containing protein [Oscillospiraceae bacterium]